MLSENTVGKFIPNPLSSGTKGTMRDSAWPRKPTAALAKFGRQIACTHTHTHTHTHTLEKHSRHESVSHSIFVLIPCRVVLCLFLPISYFFKWLSASLGPIVFLLNISARDLKKRVTMLANFSYFSSCSCSAPVKRKMG